MEEVSYKHMLFWFFFFLFFYWTESLKVKGIFWSVPSGSSLPTGCFINPLGKGLNYFGCSNQSYCAHVFFTNSLSLYIFFLIIHRVDVAQIL